MRKKKFFLLLLFIVLFCSAAAKAFSDDEQTMLERVTEKAMTLTADRAQDFLSAGWPVGGSMLEPQWDRISLMDNEVAGDGYAVTTRLRYLNALGASQYLDIVFYYNWNGNETGIEFADYSDSIAKELIPIRQLSSDELLNYIK